MRACARKRGKNASEDEDEHLGIRKLCNIYKVIIIIFPHFIFCVSRPFHHFPFTTTFLGTNACIELVASKSSTHP